MTDTTTTREVTIVPANEASWDVRFTRTMGKAVQAGLEDLASWLGLGAVEPA